MGSRRSRKLLWISLATVAITGTLFLVWAWTRHVYQPVPLLFAWNRLRGLACGDSILFANAGESVDLLNRAALSEDDLPAESWYAAAGRIEDGIDRQIRKDMADRFPGVPLPKEFETLPAAISYAYLSARIPFPFPYDADPEPLVFGDS